MSVRGDQITYHDIYRPGKDQHTKGELKEVYVHLNGRLVGTIKHPTSPASNGWHYVPKGQKTGGTVYVSIQMVKRSIEGPPSNANAQTGDTP